MNLNSGKRKPMEPDEKRRRFLKAAGATAVGGAVAIALPATVSGAAERQFNLPAGLQGRVLWKRVQDAFVLDPNSVYMNVGTTGSMPRQVLRDYQRYNRLVASDPWNMGGQWGNWPYLDEIIESIAPQFGASPEEIVLSGNTTDGMCTVLGGLNLQPDDEIITTHHEHIAAMSPLSVLAERLRVKIKVVDIPVQTRDQAVSEDAIVARFQRAVTHQTRLIVFSHITYKTGTRLPAKRICQEVAVPNNIPTLIDGAHTPGMIDLDFHGIDCDFYAGSGHKWQCGPGATGILYVRDGNQRLRRYWADRTEVFWPINSSLAPYAAYLGLTTAMQYAGQDNYPAKRALGDVCALWKRIGRERIEAYVLGLSTLCKELISERFSDRGTLFTPTTPSLSSAMTAFNPFEDSTDKTRLDEFRRRLQEEYGYIVRTTDFKVDSTDSHDNHALRISTHLFHDTKQVQGLVKAMSALYRKMPA